ncbi:MAG: NADH-quinone oxidoreductase subunit M [Actinobacteria bacterium]|nr:NADH-quinone oxidoreductase subunit M [Actinomycetota bacterium]
MPYLSIMILLPLLGSLLVFAIPSALGAARIKSIAFAIFGIVFALFVTAAMQFQINATDQFQLVESYEWITAFGVSWSVGVDGLGLVMLGLVTILVPVVLLAAWRDVADDAVGKFYGLNLLLQSVVIAVFVATDLFMFYVFFELMLVPMYFLIGRYGVGDRRKAAVKFLIFSLVGGLILLAGVISLWVQSLRITEIGSFNLEFLSTLGLNIETQRWLFVAFFIAFAIKAPLVPVHSWLPDAAQSSTPAVAVLLIGILDKVGTYAMLRFLLPLFPEASAELAPVALTLATLSIFYGALMAIGSKDMKRLMAYVSISHFGFIVLGIFAFTTQGISGAMFYMFSHGLSTAALFLAVGYLMQRTGSSEISDHAGAFQITPLLAGLILFGGLSSVALPGLASFIAEFTVLLGTFARYPILAGFATLGIVVAAVYALWLYQRTMTGHPSDAVSGIKDVSGREVIALSPVIALTLVLGFVPQLAFDLLNPTSEKVMQQVSQVDPAALIDGEN